MEWTALNDLREKFLAFFESKGHLRLDSFSLVPKNDKSLLLINSGMAPMKKYFTGEITPPDKRVVTCQKCIRTPDIERVGKTARHGTYFEMLGNFSFGDYFKTEACGWAWEFFTQTLNIPVELLWVSIYEEDEEAFDIWTKTIGVDPARMVRLGKADNFWEHGTGPCGPCSEIYFDRGREAGCGSPDCAPGCDCDRYVEVWNLVFTQFDSDGKGTYTPLAHPNIDTGMGLERLACVMQGAANLFEVDTMQSIMAHISRLAGATYGKDEKADVSLRVITDHIRSTTFMIGDGVLPSNEGRGYVLRRLLRRAARHGRLLGIRDAFLHEVCGSVIEENLSAYPELDGKREYIGKVILNEEESFARTIDTGLSLLSNEIERLTAAGDKILSGEDAFKLYDTYGFPLDLTRDVLEEQGLGVDEEGFSACMQQQKDLARSRRAKSDGEAWKSDSPAFEGVAATEFMGYDDFMARSRVLALVAEGEPSGEITAGQKGVLVTEKTPFYAEGGGQVGDKGEISGDGSVFVVEDTQKTHDGITLHIGTVRSGRFALQDGVTLTIDAPRRRAIMRNHSSLHLLQAALRQVLGGHVEQAGSYVDDQRGRLDFTHFSAMTEEELRQVETRVNDAILEAGGVRAELMGLEQARALGAMALFGEKYGDTVRVLRMGKDGADKDFSMELCGGTHVSNTGQIGLFRILSEVSVAAGVRRIECATGHNILAMLDRQDKVIRGVAETLKSSVGDVETKARMLTAEIKAAQREIETLGAKLAAQKLDGILEGAARTGDLRVATAKFTDMTVESVRSLAEMMRDKYADIVAVLAVTDGEKLNFVCACGRTANEKGVQAGQVVRRVAELTGGKGGGRPDVALAGGRDITKADQALAAAADIVQEMLG